MNFSTLLLSHPQLASADHSLEGHSALILSLWLRSPSLSSWWNMESLDTDKWLEYQIRIPIRNPGRTQRVSTSLPLGLFLDYRDIHVRVLQTRVSGLILTLLGSHIARGTWYRSLVTSRATQYNSMLMEIIQIQRLLLNEYVMGRSLLFPDGFHSVYRGLEINSSRGR